MAKATKKMIFVPVLSAKEDQVSVKFDQHLDALLDAQGVEDKWEQVLICDALCALGLADRKISQNSSGHQKQCYNSTKSLEALANDYLYSTKHWH